MTISATVRKYVEMALRERIAIACPGYSKQAVEDVVNASMKGMGVTKDTLYRAIELASNDAAQHSVHPTYGILPVSEVCTTPEDVTAKSADTNPPTSG